MLVVNVIIVEFVEEHQPNFVKARLTDALGNNWFFVDKCPIFTTNDLDENSVYPLPGVIACRIVERDRDTEGREVVTVDTKEPDHVEDTSGKTSFTVFADQLSDADTPSRCQV